MFRFLTLRSTFLFFLLAGLILACDKTPPEILPPATTDVQLVFAQQVDGQPLVFGQKIYQNAAGNPYSVDLLKYYVTNVALVRADGTAHLVHNYDLLDAAVPASCRIDAPAVPNGDYVALRFLLGVDSTRNHTGAQDGDLDPVHGMTWNWNTGYIFFKHEGRYTTTAGADAGLVYHYGTDPAAVALEIPLTGGLSLAGTQRTVHLVFDLGRLYASPNALDFNVDHYRQSALAADRPWLNSLEENFPGAFRFERAE